MVLGYRTYRISSSSDGSGFWEYISQSLRNCITGGPSIIVSLYSKVKEAYALMALTTKTVLVVNNDELVGIF